MAALAEATGADVHHLSTLWELAERAWSRSELRHDVTMEATSVAQARAAVERFDPAAQAVDARKNGRSPGKDRPRVEPPEPEQPLVATAPVLPARAASAGRAPDSAEPSPASSPSPTSPPSSPPSSPGPRGRKRVALFAGGLVGALLLVAGAVVLIDAGGDGEKRGERPTTAPATSARQQLPEGVKCAGQDCTGQDPQAMGCGTSATTTADVTVGTAYVEVRYSKTCEAAWARIARANPGDVIQVEVPGANGGADRSRSGRVGADGDAYTKMISVDSAARATACATLGGGTRACTAPAGGERGGARPVREAVRSASESRPESVRELSGARPGARSGPVPDLSGARPEEFVKPGE
ncbi:hypothetical protein SVIO_050460 [Streptomyces violaceusniger]|uniref:DUF2690 domain-containing protein n=1 Tax=Streptomyces violaceusniger TaxID=68280 RepID=A0A4D4L8N3_STRVO|nr:hypothetical protein SVIO_050460 [Streptomyces violaceusniger]